MRRGIPVKSLVLGFSGPDLNDRSPPYPDRAGAKIEKSITWERLSIEVFTGCIET